MGVKKPSVRLSNEAMPLAAGEYRLQLQTQSISVNFPFVGFAWNRPTAVLVEKDNIQQRVPILDQTRILLLTAGLFTLLMSFLTRLVVRPTAVSKAHNRQDNVQSCKNGGA